MELLSLLRTLPESIQTAIEADPTGFITLLKAVLAEPEELTWLVDKHHPLPAEYEPEDLVMLSEYDGDLVLNRNDLSLRAVILPHLQEMVDDARAQGISLDLSSTYRSYTYQDRLFRRNVEQLGLEQAERESARPGTSQHQLGTTLDFGSVTPAFADTPAGIWLAANADRYGFSLSYPDGYEEVTGYMYESWHFRYIGVAAARMERDYFSSLQQYMLEFLHTNRNALIGIASGSGPATDRD